MDHKVISASAGSGKTYRLSLEYIAIILKNIDNPEFHFERILVITFTRKAAAEIRNKIFDMLTEIIITRNTAVLQTLKDICQIEVNDKHINKLKSTYEIIKTSKDKLRISTIDSLVNTVFKTMIAPVMNLSHYSIEENANIKIWEDIFDELVQNDNIEYLKNITESNPQKNIEYIAKVLNKLIDDRWVLHFIESSGKLFRSVYTDNYIDLNTMIKEAEQSYHEFKEFFINYCKNLNALILEKLHKKPQDDFANYFKKDFLKLLSRCDSFNIDFLESRFLNIVEDFIENVILKLDKKAITLFKDKLPFYSKTKLKNCEENFDDNKLSKLFNNLIYYQYIIPESLSIIELWRKVLIRYDEIKQISPTLTYNDITWFTYNNLYNPKYSMINQSQFVVENQFYEFLSVRNQYLLIDEFQDTSFMQFMILAPMMNDLKSGNSVFEDTGLVVVGDEKQSIYGWRGGEKGLLSFMTSFLDTKSETLNTCYRSVPEIIDYVNYMFNEDNFIDFRLLNKRYALENWAYNSNIVSGKNNEKGLIKNIFFNKDNEESNDEIEKSYFDFVENVIIPYTNDCQDLSRVAIIARENKHLDLIASVLTEKGIPHIKESSQSFTFHPVIKAIMYLMRFIQYTDYNALLRFLRSDVILLDSDKLKEIALLIHKNESDSESSFFNSTEEITDKESQEIITKISLLYKKYHTNQEIEYLYSNLLTICYDIMDNFSVIDLLISENDLKNLNNFLNIISEFMLNPGDYPTNIDGFLDYCNENQHKKQMSMSLDNAITLLTIHKSKGLGFDTVFLYIDAKTKRNSIQTLSIDYLIDTKSYNALADCFISLNYKKILTELFPESYNLLKHKQIIEELNNLYVAFTRAKYNLINYWIYSEKDLSNLSIKSKLLKLSLEYEETNFNSIQNISHNKPIKYDMETNEKYAFLKDYLDIKNQNLILNNNELSESNQNQASTLINLKNHFLEKKSRLIGNAVHIYLSFIKYNTQSERYLAKLQTIRIYGSMLKQNELDEIFTRVDSFMIARADIFSEKWDKIFNEYSVIDKNKKLFRIDRMMINSTNKEIRIIDYKTGNIDDINQVDLYINLIKNLNEFKKDKYIISGEFVNV